MDRCSHTSSEGQVEGLGADEQHEVPDPIDLSLFFGTFWLGHSLFCQQRLSLLPVHSLALGMTALHNHNSMAFLKMWLLRFSGLADDSELTKSRGVIYETNLEQW